MWNRSRLPSAALVLWTLAAATAALAQEASEPVFRDVTETSGITFRHNSAPEKRYILESMSGGVAVFDYNNDDLPDIYFVNALTVETATDPKAARSALYKNLGGMKFEDVTDRAGVGYPGWGMGACVADVDGDGWRDLYVTAVGPDRLYRNQGDGTFEESAQVLGIEASGWSTGCGFADYDRDGDVDLFVSRYVAVSLDRLPEFGKGKFCQYRGVEVQCGPRGLPGTTDLLFRNDGRGRFQEVSEAAGVHDPNEYFGLGVAWLDDDNDGWLDLFVANDSGPNFLYRNQRDGTFADDAFPLGVAVSEDGGEQGSMGVALGDVRNHGRFDLFVTNFSEEYNALYRADERFFTDGSFPSGIAASSLPYVGWGTAFLDFDNDAWLDLVVVNGHVYPQLEHVNMGASAPYRQRKLAYRNRRDGTFEEIGAELGPAFSERRVGRGLAAADFDNDGRIDLVVSDLDGSPQLLRNELAQSGNWLVVDLRGAPPLTDAIGALVTVTTGELRQIRLVRSGSSYLSQEDFRQHFGLGSAAKVDSIEVRWPDGSESRRDDLAVNQVLTLEQPR